MEQEIVNTNENQSVILQPNETVESRITSEISKFSLRDAKIQELKDQYGALTIKDQDDKEGYEAVRVALGIVKGARTGFENKRKELKSDYLKIGTAIDNEAKRLTILIKPLEDALQKEKDRIDDIKEAAKLQKEREEQEKINKRINELIQTGMVFDGTMYSIGETISVDVVTVKNMPEEKYSTLLELVKTTKTKLDAAENERKEQERLQKEQFEKDQQKLKDEQEEFKRKQKELEDKEKELKQKEDDLKKKLEEDEKEKQRKLQKEKLDAIDALLRGAGMEHHLARNQWYFQNDFGVLILHHEDMMQVEVPQVEALAKATAVKIQEWKQQQADADEQKRKQQEEDDKKEEQRKELERVTKLGDLEKMKEYATKLLEIPSPEPFKSGDMATRFAQFKTVLAQLLKNLTA